MSYDTPNPHVLETLGLLTGGALHQIANPLVALVGSAELALGESEPGSRLHQRIALTHSTGTEIAEVVRALQGFIRLQAEPPRQVSVGEAAAGAIELVSRVLPTHDLTLRSSGDTTVVAGPGELRARLVRLVVDALERAERGSTIEVVVADGRVTATGGGELQL